MTAFVALLRAVNVGGAGKLPMSDLKAMCEDAGFTAVRTYIASGNVVFQSPLREAEVKTLLESRLRAYAGKPVGVLVRTSSEMAAILENNPFPDRSAAFSVAIMLEDAAPADALSRASHVAREEMALGAREIYVHYPDGQGRSKLKIPAAKTGTARNMNTIAKLAEMSAAL